MSLSPIVYAGLAAVAIGCIAYLDLAPDRKPAAASAEPARSVPVTATPAIASASVALKPPTSSEHKEASLADQIDALVEQGSPQSLYMAYRLVRRCTLARADDLSKATRVALGGVRGPDSSRMCADISSAQVASRLQYLKKAADAGVHGAARSVAEEGPAGYGIDPSLPQDNPDLIQWNRDVESAIDAGAREGDWWSLMSLSQRAELGTHGKPDYEKALEEYQRANAAYKLESGKDLKTRDEEIARLKYFIAHPEFPIREHPFEDVQE